MGILTIRKLILSTRAITRCHRTICAIAVGITLLDVDRAHGADKTEDAAVKSIFISRLEALSNFTINATESEEVTPPKRDIPHRDLPKGMKIGAPVQGRFDSLKRLVRSDRDHFLMLLKYSRETVNRVTKNDGHSPVETSAVIGLGDKTLCILEMGDGRKGGYPDSLSTLMLFSTLDIALGLRLHGENEWLDTKRVEGATLTHKDGLDILTISGTKSVTHWMAFDPANHNALVWVGLGIDGNCSVEIICTDFSMINNVPIPGKIVCYSYYRLNGVFGCSRTKNIKVTKCTVGENKPNDIEDIYQDLLAGKFPELK